MKTAEASGRGKYKSRIDAYISTLMDRHPLTAFFMIFAGGPLLTLLAAFAAVCLIALPLGFIMGWY